MSRTGRTMVLWAPDWPIVAVESSASTPAAVLHKGQVLACSQAARAEGVRRGMRRRDAQSRCPGPGPARLQPRCRCAGLRGGADRDRGAQPRCGAAAAGALRHQRAGPVLRRRGRGGGDHRRAARTPGGVGRPCRHRRRALRRRAGRPPGAGPGQPRRTSGWIGPVPAGPADRCARRRVNGGAAAPHGAADPGRLRRPVAGRRAHPLRHARRAPAPHGPRAQPSADQPATGAAGVRGDADAGAAARPGRADRVQRAHDGREVRHRPGRPRAGVHDGPDRGRHRRLAGDVPAMDASALVRADRPGRPGALAAAGRRCRSGRRSMPYA